jgi:hypothetical protein
MRNLGFPRDTRHILNRQAIPINMHQRLEIMSTNSSAELAYDLSEDVSR